MNYLIAQQWPNTKGNHTGMSHMCDLLVRLYPKEYSKIEMDQTLNVPIRRHRITRLLFKHIDLWFYKRRFFKEYLKRCQGMFLQLQEDDKIFLLEYHLPGTDQYTLAKYLKRKYPQNQLIALSHLTPSHLSILGFNKKKIQQWEKYIDKQLTLGSSLSIFFKKNGINSKKIFTGFHYVDNKYYTTTIAQSTNKKQLKAIAMGNIQRNYSLLAEVIRGTPDIDWIICCGQDDLTEIIPSTPNVQLVNYVKESELKRLMRISDVSVNIFDDTIGSNVITTSMAMGLAIIASDVGSIRDYCSSENCLFCKNKAIFFIQSLNKLKNNPNTLYEMRKKSLEMSKRFSIENFHHWLQTI